MAVRNPKPAYSNAHFVASQQHAPLPILNHELLLLMETHLICLTCDISI
jgi:hypothetical protein